MALLGMGTNTQCNGYFPAYYSTMGQNMYANSSTRPLNNIGKRLEHADRYYGFSLHSSPDLVLGYDTQALKQTILKHETMFRDQIHELHRLYRRQRELMDEMRSKELYGHNLNLEISQSNSVFSHLSTEYAQKTWHAPSLPLVNPACGGEFISDATHIQYPSSSVQGKSLESSPYAAQVDCCLKDFELLESKCKKVGKRILDLQLPAHVYIDSEDEESYENKDVHEVSDVSNYPSKRITQVMCKGDVKPFHASNVLNDFHEEASTSLRKKSRFFAVFNQPIKPDEVASMSDFVCPTSCREIPCIDLYQRTKPAFQISSEELCKNTPTIWDLESPSDGLQSEMNGSEGQQPYGAEAEKLPMLPESSHEEHRQTHQFPTAEILNKSYPKPQSKRMGVSFGRLGRNHGSSNDSQPGPSGASYMCTPHELVPRADSEISGSSSLAVSGRKTAHEMVQNPIAVQALPCFNTSASLRTSCKSSIGRPGLDGHRFDSCKSLRSSTNRDRVSFLQDNFFKAYRSDSKKSRDHPPSISFDIVNSNNNYQLASEHEGLTNYIQGSTDVKSSVDINLNFVPNFCSPDVKVWQSIQSADGTEMYDELAGGSPLLNAKSVQNGRLPKGREGPTQMESVLLKAYSECTPDVVSKKLEASDCSSARRILGFPTLNISCNQSFSHGSPSGDGNVGNTRKDEALDTQLTCDPMPDSGKRLNADENFTENELYKRHGGEGQVDLNTCLNEDESFPMHSFSKESCLQAPASPENKECSPPRGESDENQPAADFQSSGHEDANLHEELVRIAAHSLVSISSSVVEVCIKKMTCNLFGASSSGSLHWFAGIVSSAAGDPDSSSGVVLSGTDADHHDDFPPDGIDYFEAMTLKLTETKLEECCCNSNVQKEEERGATLLPSQPRKGRTRRGKQQKDFQNEIIPSLASLSRYEVTEDLQTIGGLMEAAGSHWQIGSFRNAGRSGLARGRKRSCVSASSVLENMGSSPLKQQLTGNRGLGIEERSQIDWGKITRRRRGQRCPVRKPHLL